MSKFYAYVYRDPSKDYEPIYVGKGSGVRAWRHLKRKDKHHFVHRLRKMMNDGIEPDVEIIPALDEDHAYFLEECLIAVFGRRDENTGSLLNLTAGGEGVRSMSDITKHKLSEAGKSRGYSKNLDRTGVKHTAETKKKMSDAGKKRTPEGTAKRVATRKGYTHSEETRQKMRESMTGFKRGPMSEEQKELRRKGANKKEKNT